MNVFKHEQKNGEEKTLYLFGVESKKCEILSRKNHYKAHRLVT